MGRNDGLKMAGAVDVQNPVPQSPSWPAFGRRYAHIVLGFINFNDFIMYVIPVKAGTCCWKVSAFAGTTILVRKTQVFAKQTQTR